MRSDAPAIDLNADLGESFGVWKLGHDDDLIPSITSANVACGFHGGDPATLRSTTTLCAERGIAIGAQVSYPDLLGFGRRFMDMAPNDLTDAIVYQIGALEGFARIAGTKVSYIKAHGALNNATLKHRVQAGAIVTAVREYDPNLPLLAMPGFELAKAAAAAGLRVIREGYADRAYTAEGALVSRSKTGAVLHDPREIAERVTRLAADGTVLSINGTVVDVSPDSICLHGDTDGIIAIAKAVRERLNVEGVTVRRFTGTDRE